MKWTFQIADHLQRCSPRRVSQVGATPRFTPWIWPKLRKKLTMSPMKETHKKLARLEWADQATQKMIRSLPKNRWQFVPARGARTLGELLGHFWGLQIGFLKAFETGELSLQEWRTQETPIRTSTELNRRFKTVQRQRILTARKLTSRKLKRMVFFAIRGSRRERYWILFTMSTGTTEAN